jgi:hypothetical protein
LEEDNKGWRSVGCGVGASLKTNKVCPMTVPEHVRRWRRLERRHPAPLHCVRVRDNVHVLRALVLQVVDVHVAAVRQGRTGRR